MARVLVIDDDAVFRGIAGTALRGAGHVVEEASDGQAGVDAFRKSKVPFEVVIVDMYMPGMDGIDTIFEMDAGAKGARVIAVTGGHTMGTDTLRLAGSAGADLTLEKDFTPEELVRAVEGLLPRKAKKG